MRDFIRQIDTFIVTLPREVPYLGPLAKGEKVNSRGYIVRKGNGTIYPSVDRSVLVCIRTNEGFEGWGETYGLCAPRATTEIITDILAPELVGLPPDDAPAHWDRLRNLMRVRGCSGGFYGDALAALDIALWDINAQVRGVPLTILLGGSTETPVPCYLSGLPESTLVGRIALAKRWQDQGIRAFKFAAAVSHEGVLDEMRALREALGPDADIMVDLHWRYRANEALELVRSMSRYRPTFAEAPVKPDDIAGLAKVAEAGLVPVAAGEEWFTEEEAADKLGRCKLAFIQPEMAHVGITQFVRMASVGDRHGIKVAPHATIGVGIFMAASLHASAALPNLWKHEWQHSVFEKNLPFLATDMRRDGNSFCIPQGVGLGARPTEELWRFAVQAGSTFS